MPKSSQRQFYKRRGGASPSPLNNLTVATWNILADGLAYGEFLTDEGDAKVTNWDMRCPRIVTTMSQMFENGVDLIATQENDHPEEILRGINVHTVDMIVLDKWKNPAKHSTALAMNSAERNFYRGTSVWPVFNEIVGEGSKLVKGEQLGDTICLPSAPKFSLDTPEPDGLTIYYNTATVGLETAKDPHHKGGEDTLIDIDKREKGAKLNARKIKITKDGVSFTIVNAHLAGDESIERAELRAESLQLIVDSIPEEDRKKAIILMDSNSSSLYPCREGVSEEPGATTIELGDSVLEKAIELEFWDVLGTEGHECFKVRHASGMQPNKFGILMFDQIDKILCYNGVTAVSRNLSDFTTQFVSVHDRPAAQQFGIDKIRQLRENPELRDAIKEKISREKWSDKVGECVKDTPTEDDLPFVQKVMVFRANKKDSYLIETNRLPLSSDYEVFPQIIQRELYPNVRNPSDHPPCIATICMGEEQPGYCPSELSF